MDTQFLSALEQAGELVRVKAFVDPVLEMAEVADRMAKSRNGGKALLFENTGTAFPVLMNLYGAPARLLRVLGLRSYDEVAQRIDRLYGDLLAPKQGLMNKLKMLPALREAARWAPVVVGGRGACQEVVMPAPDWSKLPVLQCWPHDGGRFVTLPVVHTKDPDTGARNAGMYRMQIFSPDTAGMHWHRHKTGARHFARFAARHPQGGRFPVAVTLGGDPLYAYCASAPMPENVDEYLLAGFLRRRPVEMVRCLTQPLEVPADADFVVEGFLDVLEPPVVEGPFGDHTGFYSLEDLYPRFRATCLTHRRTAIYPATVVGIPPQEDAELARATERIFLAPIRLALAPEVVDMHLPSAGVAHNLAIVKIRKEYPGQAIKVAHSLWGAGQMMFNKIMIVVDGETDVADYPSVLRQLAQHYRPEVDTYFSRGPLDVLDHAASAPAFGGKICLDATHHDDTEGDARTSLNNLRGDIFSFVHKGAPLPPSRIVVQFDEQVDVHDIATCVWLLGNNVDAVRDCRTEHGQLLVDATTKAASIAPRRWPNIVCASDATIAAVDAKWHRLGLGDLLASPSWKYRQLVQPGGAAVKI
jgi:4-hydroxy-3-polyprenylbenzoate decarboxylase